jgi:hypothetical protein
LQLYDRLGHGLPHDEPVIGLPPLDDAEHHSAIDILSLKHSVECQRSLHRAGHPNHIGDPPVLRFGLVTGELKHLLDVLAVESTADDSEIHLPTSSIRATVSTTA